MSETFLVTGFEPFREHRTNSSWDALEHSRDDLPGQVITRRLPVDHRLAHERLRAWLAELRPHVVLCTGLAKGRVFRIERRARRPVELAGTRGPDVAVGRWPWQELRSALESAGSEVVDSEDAGRYVCESTYWSLLSHEGHGAPAYAAFLHVPPESSEHPIARIAAAVTAAITARLAGLSPRPPFGPAPAPPVARHTDPPTMNLPDDQSRLSRARTRPI